MPSALSPEAICSRRSTTQRTRNSSSSSKTRCSTTWSWPARARSERGTLRLLGWRAARLDWLVVGVVATAGARAVVGLDAQLFFVRLFDFELRRLESAQHPRGALDGVTPRLLEPVPQRVTALIVDDFAGRSRRLRLIRRRAPACSRGQPGPGLRRCASCGACRSTRGPRRLSDRASHRSVHGRTGNTGGSCRRCGLRRSAGVGFGRGPEGFRLIHNGRRVRVAHFRHGGPTLNRRAPSKGFRSVELWSRSQSPVTRLSPADAVILPVVARAAPERAMRAVDEYRIEGPRGALLELE